MNLLGTAGPDKLVDAFARGLGAEHGKVTLYGYQRGLVVMATGLGKTWLAAEHLRASRVHIADCAEIDRLPLRDRRINQRAGGFDHRAQAGVLPATGKPYATASFSR